MRTNIVQNPKFSSNSNFWALDADFTRVATGGHLAGGYIQQTSASGYANFTTVNDANGYTVLPNTNYVFSFYVQMSVISGNSPLAYINGTSAFGATLAYTGVFDTGGGWARVSIAFNSGDHTLVYFRLANNNGNVSAKYSNFLLELGSTAGVWFDGDKILAGFTYAWLGTANASASTETASFTTYTKTFTIDGLVKVIGNLNTFTGDGIVSEIEDETGEFLIRALMDVTPSGTLFGSATYSSGSYVRLTPATNSLAGQLNYNITVPSYFIIEADLYANGSADANYIYWGCSSVPTEEESDFGGYIVALDEYTLADFEIQLQWRGTRIASAAFPHNLGDGVTRTLKVIKDGLRILVYVNNVLLIDFTDIARTYGGNKIGVGARTGAANAEHRCYRLIAYVFTPPWHPTPNIGGLSILLYRLVDIMKLTKDLVDNQLNYQQMQAVVEILATLNLSHIPISVPLDTDEDYIARGVVPSPNSIVGHIQQWCDLIHGYGMGVLFRGNFNALEKSGTTGNWNSILEVGVNRFPPGTAASAIADIRTTRLGKINRLIRDNPTWFADGDLWGIMPERTENNTSIVSIASITRSGQIATVITSGNHNVGDGQPVRISGATQTEYNGSFMITKISDSVFTITVTGTPVTPATGTKLMHFGVSVFADENSWIANTGSGVNANFAQFFIDLITVSDAAFSSIGKNVDTGFTANNYSEVLSDWISQSLLDAANRVAIDHYGITHTPGEMYNDLVNLNIDKGHVIDHQEWSDYWNGALTEQERTDYLVNFYNMLSQLALEGNYEMLNYWGGWIWGVGEGILTDTSSGGEISYGLTYFGEILSQFFNPIPEVPVVGMSGIAYGYFLDDVELKRPKGFKRQFIYQKTDFMSLTGKTTRDTSGIKEKFILTYEKLTKTQVDAINSIIEQRVPVTLTINGKDKVLIETTVWPYIGSIVYDTLGSEYRADLMLELIEVQ